ARGRASLAPTTASDRTQNRPRKRRWRRHMGDPSGDGQETRMTEKKPKIKTNRAAAKRISKTATGLVKFGAKAHRHCLSNKSRKLNRNKKTTRYMSDGDAKRVDRMIPYL